jgi:DNA polymerase III subunit epsilon
MTILSNTDFREKNLLFIDLETTGLDPQKHEILEVGCLVVDSKTLKIIDSYEELVKPENIELADPKALRIAGYSKEKWGKAKPIEDVLKKITSISPNCMIAGWKVDFDWYHLEKAFNNSGLNIKNYYSYHILDVAPLAYIYFRNKKYPKKFSLRKFSRSMNIKVDSKHSAMTDIVATYKLFRKLSKHFNNSR